MTKLSTTPPKKLMNPPMWIMPRPTASAGVVAWVKSSFGWFLELFTEKPTKTNAVCGTMMVYSGRLKFKDKFIKEHGLDL